MKPIIQKFVLVITMLCASITVSAYDFEIDGFYYEVNLEKMTAAVVAGENKQVGDIIIPEKVSYKGRDFDVVAINGAFSQNADLTGVTIPISVTTIGEQSFNGCSSLKSICGLENVTTLGISCFSGCSALTDILLTSKLEKIGANAFSGCSGFTQIQIPENVYVIGNGAFSDCTALTSILLPKNISSLSSNLFYNCISLRDIEIPLNVTTIDSRAFWGCQSLTSIVIPANVVEIRNDVFNGCSKLHNIEFSEGSNAIELGTCGTSSPLFADCPLSSVYIGRDITYPCDPSNFRIKRYYSPFKGSTIHDVQFGKTVTKLYYFLFEDCSNIASISLPKSVLTVNYGAFLGCNSISELVIEDGKQSIYFSTNGLNPALPGIVFMNDCPLSKIYIGRNITGKGINDRCGYSLLYRQTKLKSIVVGDYVTDISCLLFNSDGILTKTLGRYQELENLKIGSQLDFVPDLSANAKLCSLSLTATAPQRATGFSNSQYMNISPNIPICSMASYISAPIWKNFWEFNEQPDLLSFFEVDGICYHVLTDSTVEISSKDRPYVGDIVIPENVMYGNNQFKIVTVGDAFKENADITSIILPNSIERIDAGCFSNCTKLENMILGNMILNIPANLFNGCTSLKTIILPENLKAIDNNAFENCINLNNISFPKGTKRIGSECFKNCKNLLSISLPDNVDYLGTSVFDGCSNLKVVNWSSNLSTVPDFTFQGCINLKEIFGLSYITKIGQGAFKKCSHLQSIALGENLISIENSAFASSGLQTLSIPGSVNSIGSDVCFQCTSLSSLTFASSENPICLGNNFSINLSSSITPYPNASTVVERRTGFRNGYYDGLFHGLSIEHLVINRDIEMSKYYERTVGAPTSNYSTVYYDIIYYPPFYGLTNLKSVEIGENVSAICKNQIEAVVNAVPTTMEYANFGECDNIEVVVSNNPNAPIGGGFSKSAYKNASLFLPKGSIESYRNDAYWKNFDCISEIAFIPIESISFESGNVTMDFNESKMLHPIINPSDASIKTVKWCSSKPSIVEVSEDGKITTSSKEGEAIITAKACDGTNRSASIKIIVQEGTGISDVNADGKLDIRVEESKLSIIGKADADLVSVYNVQGLLIISTTDDEIELDAKGIYIVKVSSISKKVII